MEQEKKVVYYKSEKFYLIGEMGPVISKIQSLNGITTKMVETKYIKTPEQYEKEFNEKPFGRHDIWIN